MPPVPEPKYRLVNEDMRVAIPRLAGTPIDAVVTDPPYDLGFMGKKWDKTGIAFQPETWKVCYELLPPGAYMLCFGGTRTFHRLICAIEDAGWEIRDVLCWLYGTGFPKGRGCLKPSWEPILLCRKPGKRVLPLNINECRIGVGDNISGGGNNYDAWRNGESRDDRPSLHGQSTEGHNKGRYPANCVHDGSDEVMDAFAAFGESKSSTDPDRFKGYKKFNGTKYASDQYTLNMESGETAVYGDTGTAARFYYCAKSSKKDRGEGNTHPTIKPTSLLQWLIRLITPPNGTVLDPFMGSGSTGKACALEGRQFIGIDNDKEHGYFAIAQKRVAEAYKLSPTKDNQCHMFPLND